MIVYSVEWKNRKGETQRMWFPTEREAEDWMKRTRIRVVSKLGPNKHVIEGKRGLISFLLTYAD